MLYANPMSYAPKDISGYLIKPFKEWGGANTSSPWWRAFTSLKHDRLTNLGDAKMRHTIHSLAAVFVILSYRNEPDFKNGNITPEIYELSFPKYWTWKGRASIMRIQTTTPCGSSNFRRPSGRRSSES